MRARWFHAGRAERGGSGRQRDEEEDEGRNRRAEAAEPGIGFRERRKGLQGRGRYPRAPAKGTNQNSLGYNST